MRVAQVALSAQPFSRLLGVELRDCTDDGCVELVLPIQETLRQQHGFVHGGAIAFLADNALAFAGGARLGGIVVSSEMKVNFLRPASGNELIARAWTVSAGRQLAVARCDVFAVGEGESRLCAVAQGTISRLPGEPSSSRRQPPANE